MSQPFGRLLLGAPPADALALEREAGLTDAFLPLDRLVNDVVRRSLAGERVATLDRTRARGAGLVLPGLPDEARAWVHEARSLGAVQANGFWSVPSHASLQVGPLSTAWSLRERGRFGPGVSADERGRLALDAPETIAVWSVLAPALRALYSPVYLRTVEAGSADRAAQVAAWDGVAVTLKALGLPDLEAFEAIRYGGGWSRLKVEERHDALLAYTEALRDGLPPDAGSRLRLAVSRPLVEKYYGLAKADGTVLQKRAVSAALRPALVGVWGGSWTGLVAYLGERVHPQEHVATAIPSVVTSGGPVPDVADIARETGVSPEDVAAIAAAVLGVRVPSAAPAAPSRVDVLRRFWDVYDGAHARQRSGSSSLWGLVDSGTLGPPLNDDGVYGENLYRDLVPAPLVAEIEALWGGHVWTRLPGRTVTEWSPHARMAEAFGPALRFWDGVALTAWFVCEGPSSRTDLTGLADYHAREIAALDDAGAPVDPAFLKALTSAERLLGPPREVWEDRETVPVEGTGLTFTVRTGRGTRRDGFERVRDLVTEGRRAWADQHLDAYLYTRWERAVHGAAEGYHVAVNARGGKPPTAKQAARDAAGAVNLWMGGDLGELYRLLGEKSPVEVVDGRRVTRPPFTALADLHEELVRAGDPSSPHIRLTASRLLRTATEYVRWLEATGEPLVRDQVKEFEYYASHFGAGPDEAWDRFASAIRLACLTAKESAPRYTDVPSPPYEPVTPLRDALEAPVPQPRLPPVDPPVVLDRPWWKRILGG